MEFEFFYNENNVGVNLKSANDGFLKKLFGNSSEATITSFAKEDQYIALALADLKFSAEEVGSEILFKNNAIEFSHKVLSSISSNFATKLSLPPIVHLTLQTDVVGIPGRHDFKLKYQWTLDGQKQNPKRTGAILKTSEGLRRIPSWLLDAIEMVDAQATRSSLEYNWSELAKFRKALEPNFEISSSSIDTVEMSNFLKDLKVKISDGFSISPDEDKESGLFEVIPFSNHHIQQQLENGEEEIKASMSELDPDELQAFQKRFRSKGALSAYMIEDKSYLVVEPESKPALDVMAQMQHAPLNKRKNFIQNPRLKITAAIEKHMFERGDLSGLNEAQREEAIERASLPVFIETAEYSERVTGKVIYIGNLVSNEEKIATTWLPEAFDEPQRNFLKDLPLEDLNEVKEKIQQAFESGHTHIVFNGHSIPATHASSEAIKSLIITKTNDLTANTLSHNEDDYKNIEGPTILESQNNFEQTNWRAEINPRKVVIPATIPRSVTTALHPHQEDGFDWQISAWQAGLPGILNADEQGLGKTLQTLAFLAWLREQLKAEKDEKPKGPILIVAPTTLLENWEQEIGTHMSSGGLGQLIRLYGSATTALKRIGAKGIDTQTGEDLLDLDFLLEATNQGQGQTFWILTTYTTLTNYQHSLGKIPFSVAVFDEIQAMKNPGSLRALAGTAMQADFSIGLTGTPIENTTSDIWAILDQISPGRLIPLGQFRQEFSSPNEEKLRHLYELIFQEIDGLPPMALRRLKDDVASDLPRKTRILHAEAMSKKQAAAYEEARGKLVAGQKGAALKMLHHIRSVSVHPDISAELSSNEFIELSARLKLTFEILDKIHSQNERALVFIEHIQMQYRFIELLKVRYDIERVDLINGKTPIKQRQKIVNKFQSHLKNDRGFDVLVLGPKAAGTGLTLTAATHVIHLSRWWNPAVEEQCNDRVHRIGQTKPITVHVPLSVHPEYEEKSFDLLLHSLMTRKRKMASDALWPMGDTEADMQELQKLLSESSQSRADVDFVKNSILRMFERDKVIPAKVLNDRTYVYD